MFTSHPPLTNFPASPFSPSPSTHASPADSSPIKILMSGLPGRMASETAGVLLEHTHEFDLAPEALAGPEIESASVNAGGREFTAITPIRRAELENRLDDLKPFIAVDFSLPVAIPDNVEWFCRHQIPFVMGTTGGDREWIRRKVEEAGLTAVVSPNMAIPIVLAQAAARWLALTFPGALAGHKVSIRESHQAGKKDTSGTAKAIAADLSALGLPARLENIEMIRDSQRQLAMGVPPEHLAGHAFHTYTVESPKGDVALSFSHNVLGRRVYAEGTVWAIRFLHKRLQEGKKAVCYEMLDVLRSMNELAY